MRASLFACLSASRTDDALNRRTIQASFQKHFPDTTFVKVNGCPKWVEIRVKAYLTRMSETFGPLPLSAISDLFDNISRDDGHKATMCIVAGRGESYQLRINPALWRTSKSKHQVQTSLTSEEYGEENMTLEDLVAHEVGHLLTFHARDKDKYPNASYLFEKLSSRQPRVGIPGNQYSKSNFREFIAEAVRLLLSGKETIASLQQKCTIDVQLLSDKRYFDMDILRKCENFGQSLHDEREISCITPHL